MIRTIFGGGVKAVRYATLRDVRRFEGGRKPDSQARQAVRDKSWVIVTRPDDSQFITHIAKLVADGGLTEIVRAAGAA